MNRLITLIALLATTTVASAQSVQFGVTGDIAFDQYKDGFFIPKDAETNLGWSLGAKLKVSSLTGFGGDISLKIAQEDRDYFYFGDFATSGVLVNSDYEMKNRFTYIGIPVNVRYDFDFPLISHILIPFAFAGPEMHFNFNQYDLEEVAESMKDLNTSEPLTSYLKQNRINWDINFGFGAILGERVELAYYFKVRTSEPFKSEFFEPMINNKTNKIALTLYF